MEALSGFFRFLPELSRENRIRRDPGSTVTSRPQREAAGELVGHPRRVSRRGHARGVRPKIGVTPLTLDSVRPRAEAVAPRASGTKIRIGFPSSHEGT
jgi:hypothetical protein